MKIWALLFAALASASPVVAQEVTATPPLVPQHSQTILETLVKAGPVMIPLLLLSIFFVMLVVVYLMTIRRGAVVSSGYMATADALLRKRDYLGLLAVSNRHGEAIAALDPPAVALRVKVGGQVVVDGEAVSRHPVIGEGKGRGEIGRTPAGRAVEASLEGIALAAAQPLRQAPIGAATGEGETRHRIGCQAIIEASGETDCARG